MTRYARDPYWLTTKYRTICAKCHGTIKAGEQAFYYPSVKQMFCDMPACGKHESARFDCAAQDEEFINRGMEY